MKLNIIKRTKVSLAISLAIILLGVVMTVINGGLNLGIDFTGGSIVTLEFGSDYETAKVEEVLSSLNAGEVSVVKSETQAVIRLEEKPEEELSNINNEMITKLQETYPNVTLEGVDRVGAVASQELVLNAIISVAIACVLILIYVSLRFEFYSGLCAVLALIHDVAIMIAFVAIIRLPINSGFIAGVLTIVGYSINGTILVFDRFRENKKLYGKTMKNDDLINKSINDTITRSLYTSLTTLVTVVVLYILGVDTIKEFTLPIMVGLIAGAFSSIFLAGQWWHFFITKVKKA